MKKTVFSFLLILVLCLALSAQEKAGEKSSLLFSSAAPQMIVHQEGIWNYHKFEFLDGTKIKGSALNDVLRSAPENEQLIKKTDFWKAVGIAGGLVLAGGIAGMCFTDNDTALLALSAVSLGGAFSVVLSARGVYYRTRAVDNYNLYALGLKRAE